MRFDDDILGTVNALRDQIIAIKELPTIDDGESVTIALWWSFLNDHAETMNLDLEELARAQFEAFLPYALKHMKIVRPN